MDMNFLYDTNEQLKPMNQALIPEWGWEKFQEKLAKLNRRAEKLGVDLIGVIVLNPSVIHKHTVKNENTGQEREEIDVFRRIEFRQGKIRAIGEYEFVARIELGPDEEIGNMVFMNPFIPRESVTDEAISTFYKSTGYCDHCKTARRRNDVFVVRQIHVHESSSTYFQVGRNCLRDFLPGGEHEAERIIAESIYINSVIGLASDDDWGFGGGRTVDYIQLNVYAAHVCAVMRVVGGYKRFNRDDWAESWDRDSSAGVAYWSCKGKDGNPLCVGKDCRIATEDADYAEANELLWKMAFSLKDKEELSPFEQNLKVIIARGYIDRKTCSFMAGGLGYGKRVKEQEKSKKLVRGYVGEVGKRVDLKDITLLDKRAFDSNFGTTVLHRFQDPDGNILIWWASNGSSIEEGLIKGMVRGTIKAHEEHEKYGKQTVINRVKVIL